MANYYAHQAEDNRTRALQRGDQINSQLQDQVNNRSGLEGGYRQTSDQLYGDLLDQPGYSDQQKEQILNQRGLDNLQMTPDQMNSNYLTDQESAGIHANPNNIRAVNPSANIDAALNQTQDRVGRGLGAQSDDVHNAQNQFAARSRAAIDPSKLGLSSSYSNALHDSLGGTAGKVRSAYGDPNLGLSDQYKQDYKFGPQDQERMALAAETGIGNATRARQEDVSRAAAAAGGSNYLALSAGLNRLQQQGDINAQDAKLQAQIQAKRLGLDTSQTAEATRLGAAQNRAGLATSSEQSIGNRDAAALANEESQRLGANQYLTGTQLGNETTLGQSDLANSKYLGSANINNQQQLGSDQIAAQEYEGNLGNQQEQYIDTSNSARAAQTAQNRQAVNQYNQGQQFQRGTYADAAGAARQKAIADTGLAGQQKARDYYTGAQQYQGTQGNAAQANQTGLYGTEYGLANQSTGIAANYDIQSRRTPGIFDKILGAVGGAAKGFAASGRGGGGGGD